MRLALAYVVLGLVVAVAGGMLMDRMGLEGEAAAAHRGRPRPWGSRLGVAPT